ncbi:MAG: isocitrate/isopropylmalate dehydrogenase family protein [Phycisphaerae bacterium]
MTHTVCLVPGDGIGPEVTSAAKRVIEAANVDIEWVNLPAGETGIEFFGNPLPERTIAAIIGHGIALKGPITTQVAGGHGNVSIRLRQRLGLSAAVRPVRSIPGVKALHPKVDLIVIRENTEGLFAGIENEIAPGVTQALKVCTAEVSTRIGRFAFEYALSHDRRKVTVFHRADLLRRTDGLLLRCVRKAHRSFADQIAYEEMNIDNGCMQLVRNPSQFDVILLDSLTGGMVSSIAAGLVGGPGMVPSASFGSQCVLFEPVHGSAPDIARKGIANPLACILSGVMMLEHLGEDAAASRIRSACELALSTGDASVLTPDLGGSGSTASLTDAIIRALK